MTKKENFGALHFIVENFVNDEIFTDGGTLASTTKEDLLAFIDHEVKMLENRKGTSNSKAKAETAERAEKAFTALAEMEEPVTITDFQKLTSDEDVAGWSNQRLARLLNTLVAEGRVAKEMRKKRAYFSVA